MNLNDDTGAGLAEGDRYMQAYYSVPYDVISKNLLCVFRPGAAVHRHDTVI